MNHQQIHRQLWWWLPVRPSGATWKWMVVNPSSPPPQAHCLASHISTSNARPPACVNNEPAALPPLAVTARALRLLATTAHARQSISGVMAKPTVMFVLGGPGAGKGTQCGRIVDVRTATSTEEALQTACKPLQILANPCKPLRTFRLLSRRHARTMYNRSAAHTLAQSHCSLFLSICACVPPPVPRDPWSHHGLRCAEQYLLSLLQ